MSVIRGGFSSLMAPGIRKVIFAAYDEQAQVMPKIFNVNSSSRQYEDDRQITGLGTVPEKPEGTAVLYSDPLEGWTKRYTHTSYGLGIRVTKEMYEDDQYNVARRFASQLGRSMQATVEQTAANIFINGFSDTGPDGQNMFDTGHDQKSGGTIANRPATDADLSVASLEAALTTFMSFEDEMGLFIAQSPKILLVSNSDYITAQKIIQSSLQPFTADNQKNVITNYGLTIIPWTYLTDTDAWFLLTDKTARELNWFWRRKPTMSNDDDFDTDDAKYKITSRFSCGYSDWRGMYGTSGSG